MLNKKYLFKSWKEFWPEDEDLDPYLHGKHYERTDLSSFEKNKFYIANAYFKVNNNDDIPGGAIYYKKNADDIKFLIEFSTFFECTTCYGNGGAINFECKSKFYMNKCCGFGCHADSDYGSGMFIASNAVSEYTLTRKLLDLSISSCVPNLDFDTTASIYFLYVFLTIENTNFSYNKAVGRSEIYYHKFTIHDEEPCHTSYCNCFNGTSTKTVFYFRCKFNNIYSITATNFISNMQTSEEYGLFELYAINFNQCVFIDNKSPLMFSTKANVTFRNCAIPNEQLLSINEDEKLYYFTEDVNNSYTFYNLMKFTHTDDCFIINKRKQETCYSYQKSLDSILFITIWLL